MTLALVPVTLAEANAFVTGHHRHHKPVPGAKFCVGASDGERIVGVAIVGRPVSRMADDGWTLPKVNRVATDGASNACSLLYGACRRAAWALGYRKLVTYTLPEEGGASLRAAGYRLIGERGGGKLVAAVSASRRYRAVTKETLMGGRTMTEGVNAWSQ